MGTLESDLLSARRRRKGDRQTYAAVRRAILVLAAESNQQCDWRSFGRYAGIVDVQQSCAQYGKCVRRLSGSGTRPGKSAGFHPELYAGFHAAPLLSALPVGGAVYPGRL